MLRLRYAGAFGASFALGSAKNNSLRVSDGYWHTARYRRVQLNAYK